VNSNQTTLEPTAGTAEPWANEVSSSPTAATPARPANSEDIQRVQVDEEDRLAFRVGVNLITLVALGLGVYFLVRRVWF